MEGEKSGSLANQNKRKKPIEPNQNVDLDMKTNGKDKPEDKPNIDTNSLMNETKKIKHDTSPRKNISTDYEPGNQWPPAPTYGKVQKPPKFEEHSEQRKPTNEKALQRFAPTYELEKFEKNALLIFNQENIDNFRYPRFGTHVDVEALTNTFEKFGFEVKNNIHHDLKKKDVLNKVKEFTSKDFTDYGCIGIVVLTHGSSNGRLRAKDTYYSELDIMEYLKVSNNRTLVTKPKFVIIQACRGDDSKKPVPVFHPKKICMDHTDLELYYLPEQADSLILHSCYVGSPSFRDEVNGTWFIETLCKAVDQLASTHDLMSIITEVMRRVAIDKFQQECKNLPVQTCQMPVLMSTLIRKLYLKKFGDAKPLDDSSVLPVVSVISGDQATTVQRGSRQALPLAFGPCVCFLDHFEYIRNCLRHFVISNPDDKESKYLLDLAEEYQGPEVDACKIHMIKIIQMHLMNNAKGADYYNYLHLFVYDN